MQKNKIQKIRINLNYSNKVISILLILIAIILILITSTFSTDLNSQQYIKLKIKNQINFDINKKENPYIEYFYLTSSFFPQTYENVQYLNQFNTTNPNYQILNHSSNIQIKYSYDSTSLKEKNQINENFIIESLQYTPQIKTKQSYPIKYVSNENKIYLEYKDLIDINDDIKIQASNLAQGEDDAYIIASKVAKWIIEDINYNLKTALENPNQKSTDVFKSKLGVCKEISNLYVSMMRSLGIPTRLVTGYAYTESDELVDFLDSNWGGHAWTEVLIGDIWVPFDLTYNQYGYTDATHIIFDKSAYLKTGLVGINGSGRDFNIVENSLKTKSKFEVIESRDKISNDNKYQISVGGPNEVGFDSYGYINVEVENTKDYYQNIYLIISKPKEVELLDNEKKMIILKPNEKKEIKFRYKIPQLDSGYYYTFPFNIQNDEINIQYNVSVKEEYLKLQKDDLPEENIEKKKFTNNNLDISCSSKLDYPKNTITCTIKNTNNYEIDQINACLRDECQNIDLKLNEQKQITFLTSNFSEQINFKILNQTSIEEINIKKPQIQYSKNITGDRLSIDYSIYNFQNNLKLNIYNNEKLVNSSNKEKDKLNVKLNVGENNISLKIELKDKIFDETKLKINLIEEKINIFEQIIEWILGLFK